MPTFADFHIREVVRYETVMRDFLDELCLSKSPLSIRGNRTVTARDPNSAPLGCQAIRQSDRNVKYTMQPCQSLRSCKCEIKCSPALVFAEVPGIFVLPKCASLKGGFIYFELLFPIRTAISDTDFLTIS
jgi:hypothetical protein